MRQRFVVIGEEEKLQEKDRWPLRFAEKELAEKARLWLFE